MTNRAMQAKTAKMKRMRRSHLKQYSNGYIPAELTPNIEVMAGYKHRAKSLAFDKSFLDYVNGKFPRQDVSPQRQAVLNQIKQIEYNAHDIKAELMFFTLIENCYQRARIYFDAGKTYYVCVHEDFKNRILKRSISYSSKDRIIQVYNMDKIIWVEHTTWAPQISNSV